MELKEPINAIFPEELDCRILNNGNNKFVGIKLSQHKGIHGVADNYDYPFKALTPEMAEHLVFSLIEALNRLDGKQRRLSQEG